MSKSKKDLKKNRTFKASDAEFEIIQHKAAKAMMSVSAYIRHILCRPGWYR